MRRMNLAVFVQKTFMANTKRRYLMYRIGPVELQVLAHRTPLAGAVSVNSRVICSRMTYF